MQLEKGICWCGTSNVEVPEPNKKAFPAAFQAKSHLEYYASLFNSVEINRTFYQLPRPATMARWAAQTPAGFRFSVKLWKEITHVKELRYKPEDLQTFMQSVAPIGMKKGCLLIQFPAALQVEYATALERLLGDITVLNPQPAWRIAIEFRNRGWYTPAIDALLHRYKAIPVLHDMPFKGEDPLQYDHRFALRATLPAAAGFVFKRYHGPKGDYKGSYPPAFLEKEAAIIREWLHQGKDVYAYFNNTAGGDAPKNAGILQNWINSPERPLTGSTIF